MLPIAVVGAQLSGCTPDGYEEPTAVDGGIFVEGYADPNLGIHIVFTEITPFRECKVGGISNEFLEPESVLLVSTTGDTLAIPSVSAGTYAADTTQMQVDPNKTYRLIASFGRAVVISEPTRIPGVPVLSFGSGYRGALTSEDYDLLLDVTARPEPGYALAFDGEAGGGLNVDYCNQQHTANRISARCRATRAEVEFTIGWFAFNQPSDTLTASVSNVTDGYANYLSTIELNAINDQLSGFIYFDPNTLPSNLENAYGYFSFQNSKVITIAKPD